MKIMNRFIQFTVICSLFMQPLFAAKWYKVDVLAYANKEVPLQGLAGWPNFPFLPDVREAKELLPNEKHLFYKPYESLPRLALTLNEQEKQIREQDKKELLFHYAWLQQINSPEQTQPVHLFGADISQKPSELSHPDALLVEPPYSTSRPWKLNGLISISGDKDEPIMITSHFIYQNKMDKQIITKPILQTQAATINKIVKIKNPFYTLMIEITPYA